MDDAEDAFGIGAIKILFPAGSWNRKGGDNLSPPLTSSSSRSRISDVVLGIGGFCKCINDIVYDKPPFIIVNSFSDSFPLKTAILGSISESFFSAIFLFPFLKRTSYPFRRLHTFFCVMVLEKQSLSIAWHKACSSKSFPDRKMHIKIAFIFRFLIWRVSKDAMTTVKVSPAVTLFCNPYNSHKIAHYAKGYARKIQWNPRLLFADDR